MWNSLVFIFVFVDFSLYIVIFFFDESVGEVLEGRNKGLGGKGFVCFEGDIESCSFELFINSKGFWEIIIFRFFWLFK